MEKVHLFFFLFILLLSVQGCSSLFVREPEFIRVKGTQFSLNDKPYYFVGTNFWYGCYLGMPGEEGDRERLERELDRMKQNGISNLRIIAASEQSYLSRALQPVFQTFPGIYNEKLLEGLDFLLAEMRKREMHAVIFLNNYWEWSGGFSVYNKWFGKSEPVDPNNPEQGWGAFMDYSAEFYRNEKANEAFKNHILKIITRKNKFTGDYYFEDPTIMAWQLANEPRPGKGEESYQYVEYYYKWIDETAAYIKSLDANHLVSSGSEGLIGSIQIDEVFLKAHQSKNIDYATFHLWVKNWNWYDSQNPEETFPTAEIKAVDYINKHITYAKVLNKPLTLEEFGIGRDKDSCNINAATFYRDRFYTKILKTVYDSAASSGVITGSNFWGWGGEARSMNADYIWQPGDPLMCDPPHEPQGINSVFDTDISTINIIKEFAGKMEELTKKELIKIDDRTISKQ